MVFCDVNQQGSVGREELMMFKLWLKGTDLYLVTVDTFPQVPLVGVKPWQQLSFNP